MWNCQPPNDAGTGKRKDLRSQGLDRRDWGLAEWPFPFPSHPQSVGISSRVPDPKLWGPHSCRNLGLPTLPSYMDTNTPSSWGDQRPQTLIPAWTPYISTLPWWLETPGHPLSPSNGHWPTHPSPSFLTHTYLVQVCCLTAWQFARGAGCFGERGERGRVPFATANQPWPVPWDSLTCIQVDIRAVKNAGMHVLGPSGRVLLSLQAVCRAGEDVWKKSTSWTSTKWSSSSWSELLYTPIVESTVLTYPHYTMF